ncbi:hypothetical protein MBLNU13_g06710t1 [Cladosporium sp. NU13]
MAGSMSDYTDNSTLEPLRVQTRLQSRYNVFDASGRLPFDIVFGIRRRSDSYPRDISFQTTNSFLDVPHALANGILSLHEQRTSTTGAKKRIEVDLSRLREAIKGNEPTLEYITLPSKSNKTDVRGQMGVTEYRYRINPGSPLASLFESGKKYSIALANRNLGNHHRWVGSDHVPLSSNLVSTAERSIESCNIVSNPHSGFAVFSVVESLIWPPTVETRMCLLSPPKGETSSSEDQDRTLLQVTVANTGSDVISVQTRGQQRFLSPWGPFQPGSDDGLNAGRRPCIIDPCSATANLQLIDVATGSVVRHPPKPGICGLTSGRPDLRPTVDQLVVLTPGIAVSREIQLDRWVRGLDNGRYLIRLIRKGCWWHFGDIKGDPDHDGKVSKRYVIAKQTPVVLESDDQVEFELIGGRIVKHQGRTSCVVV